MILDEENLLLFWKTLFAVGSNSKLFAALGIGLLTANESIPIDWDTKIKDILPTTLWTLQDPIAQDHADLVDILSHRTGLPRHDMSYSQTDTPESAVSSTFTIFVLFEDFLAKSTVSFVAECSNRPSR